LRFCNVGITGERDLWITCDRMPWYIYEVSIKLFRVFKTNKGDTNTDTETAKWSRKSAFSFQKRKNGIGCFYSHKCSQADQ
jgi:hypothetical protein